MVGRQSRFSRRFSRRFTSASDRLSWLPYLSYAKTTSWRMRSRPTMRIFGEVFSYTLWYQTRIGQPGFCLTNWTNLDRYGTYELRGGILSAFLMDYFLRDCFSGLLSFLFGGCEAARLYCDFGVRISWWWSFFRCNKLLFFLKMSHLRIYLGRLL